MDINIPAFPFPTGPFRTRSEAALADLDRSRAEWAFSSIRADFPQATTFVGMVDADPSGQPAVVAFALCDVADNIVAYCDDPTPLSMVNAWPLEPAAAFGPFSGGSFQFDLEAVAPDTGEADEVRTGRVFGQIVSAMSRLQRAAALA